MAVRFENDTILEASIDEPNGTGTIVDIEIRSNILPGNVRVRSRSVTKVYDFNTQDYKLKRIVFDTEKIKLRPQIQLKYGNKKSKITIDEADQGTILHYVLEQQGVLRKL